MPTVIMNVGLSGSGKTSGANELEKYGYRVLSSDDFRACLLGDVNDQSQNGYIFQQLYKVAKELLRKGENIIIDATNLSRKRRMAFIREFRSIPDINFQCDCYLTPLEVCIANQQLRERKVPAEVIVKQAKQFQLPIEAEGWDDVKYRYPFPNCLDDISHYLRYCYKFDQKNPHHNLDLYTHMSCAADYFDEDRSVPDEVAIAAFYHDIGKPWCQEIGEDGVAHYNGHHNLGCYLFLTAKDEISKSWKQHLYIASLIEHHMDAFFIKDESGWDKLRTLYGDQFIKDLELLHEADLIAKG